MLQRSPLLIIEIKTVEQVDFNPAQVTPMTVFQDSAGRYHLATGIKQIESAIIDSIPHLGSNFRHPLLFDVQILPGDNIDALMASINYQKSRITGQRVRRTGR
jgi:hypothetical protein